MVFTRLYAAHHWDMHGPARSGAPGRFSRARSASTTTACIRTARVARVRLGSVEWPINPLGYRAGKQPNVLAAAPVVLGSGSAP